LVEKAGKITVPVLSVNEPKPGDLVPGGVYGPRERERIPLAKMFGMPRGRALVWKPGDDAPRIAHVKGYFEIPKLARRASPNPYFTGGKRRPGVLRRWAKAAIALTVASVVIGGALVNLPDTVRAAWPSWNTGPVLHQVPPRPPSQHHRR
jgi:hypothetical protein